MEAISRAVDFACDEVPDLHALLAPIVRGPRVAQVRYHGQSAWLIAGHAELAAAFADEDSFPSSAMYRIHSEPVMGRTLQCMDGEEHRRSRGLVSARFLPAAVRACTPAVLEPVAHAVVDAIVERGEADLVGEVARLYPFRVILRLLGIPVSSEPDFLHWAEALVSYPWDPQGALDASAAFTRYLAPVIEERRRSPGDDVLSALATAEIDGERLTDEEIFSFVRLLFPAGSDTTFLALGSLFYALLTHPDVYRRLRQEPQERRWAVEEVLRWEPPVALLPRMCARGTTLAGVDIPAGSPMLFGITAANRDPRVYSDPDRFDPARRSRDHLTFGRGEHFCLGSHLARREMQTLLDVVLDRLPNLRLVDPDAVRITGAVLRGPRELRVAFDA